MKGQIVALIMVVILCTISGIEGQLGDPSLRCPRCPIACPSPQGYPLSCRNACKSYNTRFTEVQCSAGRCNCRDPRHPTTTNAIRPSSG